uniref:Uncharacterized protein n=1 Tax=Setaria italica TaxID=4555 RepID=K3XRG1_SETIT
DTFDNLKAKVQMCLVRILAENSYCEEEAVLLRVIIDKETFSYGSKGIYAVVFPSLNNENVAINFTDFTNPVTVVHISESEPLINEDAYTLGYQNPL